jgi:hypothetical protein
MEQTAIEIWLTRIGAGAGLIAIMFRAYEFYRDRRPNLSVHTWDTSDPERGNTILILNASKVPTNIYSYSLETAPRTLLSRRWPRFTRKWDTIEFHLEDRYVDIDVPAYSQVAIPFAGQDHYDTSVRRMSDLYLRIWIVGRSRPLSFLVAEGSG